jgi:hypothetical protein
MKFAHIADCHIGSWKDPKTKDLSMLAFSKAVDLCISKEVDFVIIAGDLFNTSLPAIDKLKDTVIKLKQLKDRNIPVYLVAGSHDFSPSGKTFLDVLESAGLCINVVRGEVIDNTLKLKFTIDKKTGAKITGMLGKKGQLEKSYYESLSLDNLEKEDGFKIFVFHSLLSEFKPEEFKELDAQPLSLLPKGFDYYAGGHPHMIFSKTEENYGLICYPGPIFPNNFKELEDLQNGGFYIWEDGSLSYEPVLLYNVFSISIDCNHKSPQDVEIEIKNRFQYQEFIDTIVTLRLFGILLTGKPSDINFKELFQLAYDKGAYFVMKNTAALQSEEFEDIKVEQCSVSEMEEKLIREQVGKLSARLEDEISFTKQLMAALSSEKEEDERQSDFEARILEGIKKIVEQERILDKE